MILRTDIEQVSKLARLRLTDDEMERFTPQMEQILAYVEKLNEIDTSTVEPTAHVLNLSNVFRDDLPRPSLSRPDVLANAPDATESAYRVPRIIET